jgi:hypothetical protein
MEAKGEEGGEEQVDEEQQNFPQRLGCLGVVEAAIQISKCLTIVPESGSRGRETEGK